MRSERSAPMPAGLLPPAGLASSTVSSSWTSRTTSRPSAICTLRSVVKSPRVLWCWIRAFPVCGDIGFIYASAFIGFNLAVSPVISYNYGAQNHAELKNLLHKSLILLFVIGTLLTIVSEVLSNPMAGLFVSYDPQLKALTAHAIRLYMLSFMICGLNMFVSAFFTALNNGLVHAF